MAAPKQKPQSPREKPPPIDQRPADEPYSPPPIPADGSTISGPGARFTLVVWGIAFLFLFALIVWDLIHALLFG
jgi:hypothetical protein